MTDIKPFQAFIYNPEEISDAAAVVSPPYDIISPSRQKYFHGLHPYNLTHIDLGKDIPGEDKYQRAGRLFGEWIKKQVLVQDDRPAVYFYSQQFTVRGEKRTRVGFFSLLRLPEQESTVFAHEHTRAAPKEDRLRLIREVKANLSPIFVAIADHKRVIQRMFQKHVQDQKPFIVLTDDEKVTHKLWRLVDPEALREITAQMRQENIFIADGHHRYEVSCLYRNEMKEKQAGATGDEGSNYILAYFTSAESRDLTIFPIHRLVTLPGDFTFTAFRSKLSEYFDIEDVKDKAKFFFMMEKAGSIEHVLGMYYDRHYRLLRLKNVKILDTMIAGKPAQYRSLDVSVLNYVVLNKVLGMSLEDTPAVEYIHDTEELLHRVDAGVSQAGFLLNPVRMQQIMAVDLKGEKMPPKSTYFYPKVLSGLVIHKF